MPEVAQQTLSGDEATCSRTRPETMVYCEECDEWLLRRQRHDHEHEVLGTETVIEQQRIEESKEKVPDHANLSTATYRVEFHYEVVETIVVEATDKADAKREAEHQQTYDGEYMETIHTSKRQVGDESLVSIEYLERNGLLPEDHDVTEADLRRAAEVDDDE